MKRNVSRPHYAVLSLHGPQRHERFDEIARHDLILTTYALAWRDESVLSQCGRHDNERRLRETVSLLFGEQVRQRLYRLAQSHIVGQHTRKIVFAQKPHPCQSLTLIAA